MLRLTFDTCVLIDSLDDPTRENLTENQIQNITAARILRNAANAQLIDISYNQGESIKNKNGDDNLHPAQGVWIIGVTGFSELDKSTVLADGESSLNEIRRIFDPNGESSFKDFAILSEHFQSSRDIFVTTENKHLKKRKAFEKYGLIVMSPNDVVELLRDKGILGK
ncbi:MAG: hypothetical protein OHK0046_32310 [Anaerolineae bacterium]